MKLIVGLGNPEQKYEQTRHNFGFMVLDEIVKNNKFMPFRLENQFQSLVTQTGGVGENRVTFSKPQTYMNNSGKSVKKMIDYYKIGTDDVLVVCDDIDMPLGSIRIRLEGSSGGHKGLQSIIDEIGDNRIIRIRLGIGSNKELGIPSENYVLQKFSATEMEIVTKVIDKTGDLVLNWANNGEIKEETIKIM
jgi:PTH1 family peptidyl-tRNA hydrolase